MQPVALVSINGSVLNVRPVTEPAREAVAPSERHPKGRPAFAGMSFVEVTLLTSDAALGGEDIDGLVATCTVRFQSDAPVLGELATGVVVDLLVQPFVDTYFYRGNYGNSVGYRFSRLATPVRQAVSLAS